MVLLCIMDGFGLSDDKNGNSVFLAKKPNLDMIFEKYKMVKGNASGEYVGLPAGQMGNSEVGHLNIGSGRVVYQDISRINRDIENKSFFSNEEFLNAINHAKKNHSSIHLMGLLSDGGVHSLNTHLYALLKLMKENDFNDVYIDCFLDGRDTPPDSGVKYLNDLILHIKEIGIGKISSISGRYYAMDRDKNYDRIKKAYDALTLGDEFSLNAIDYIHKSYQEEKFDEFVLPKAIGNIKEVEKNKIKDGDSIIFFNFRPDRARQLTRAFLDDEFTFFERKKLNDLYFVCFTDYDESIKGKHVAFKKEDLNNTLGEIVSKQGLKQLRIAETEKYAHVTFFFNGGREVPFSNEDRILINSPKVKTYDLKPEMSAFEVLDNLLKKIDEKIYDLIVVNFANPDMVGHTGVLEASIKAVETVDYCVGKLYEKIVANGDYMFICADHGNAEKMIGEGNKPYTAHTSNPVPFVLVNNEGLTLEANHNLCDIAPTILDLLKIEKPKEMTGQSIIIKGGIKCE